MEYNVFSQCWRLEHIFVFDPDTFVIEEVFQRDLGWSDYIWCMEYIIPGWLAATDVCEEDSFAEYLFPESFDSFTVMWDAFEGGGNFESEASTSSGVIFYIAYEDDFEGKLQMIQVWATNNSIPYFIITEYDIMV